MITKLKNITFVFENCEYVTIDGKYVGEFLANDIRTSFERIASNCISRMDVAHTFVIEIHKDADKATPSYGFFDDNMSAFDRIMLYNDITSIEFELVEQYVEEDREPLTERYEYYVHWTGDSEIDNASQKSYVSKLGNLYLVIANGKDIGDFFDMEINDNAEHKDFVYSMYEIGDKYSEEIENESKSC